MSSSKKQARFQFSIAFLLGLTCIAACGLFFVSTLTQQRSIDHSNAAEMNLSKYYVSIDTDFNPDLIGSAVHSGHVPIHPKSCGPSLDLSGFGANDIRAWYPVLDLLLPRPGKSHVAIYLSPQLVADITFIQELNTELPNYAIFDHSQIRFHKHDSRTP